MKASFPYLTNLGVSFIFSLLGIQYVPIGKITTKGGSVVLSPLSIINIRRRIFECIHFCRFFGCADHKMKQYIDNFGNSQMNGNITIEEFTEIYHKIDFSTIAGDKYDTVSANIEKDENATIATSLSIIVSIAAVYILLLCKVKLR